jgi:hypothetical protein
MKYAKLLLIALLTFSGIVGAATRSVHLGKSVWSPRVLEWRNPFRRPPKIDLQPDSPLLISRPRYYSFMSLGFAIGGELRFDVANRSNNPVHSYDCRYYSPVSVGNGSYGNQPEAFLPGESREDLISAHEFAPLTLTIDFVQFADGSTWFSGSPESSVKPDGVKAGAKAAVDYLRGVMSRGGVQNVMGTLPRIHADVRRPPGDFTKPEFGTFGFYCGVTNIAVRVEREYKEGGAERVEAFLRSYKE